MVVALDVNRQDRVRLGAIGQHARSDASTGLAMKRIAHGRYGKVPFVWRSRQAGSDGIEARLLRPQGTDQGLGCDAWNGEPPHNINDVVRSENHWPPYITIILLP